MNNLQQSQKGFTLMELMIAIVLGLLIVAAVTQVYVMAIRTASSQKASAGILDANVYGMQQIERSLRMAGLGLGDSSRLNNSCGGILIRDTNALTECSDVTGATSSTDATTGVTTSTVNASPIGAMASTLWTTDATGPSHTSNNRSPQLTIQYRAPVNMRDCEGNLALGPRQVVGSSASKASATTTTNGTTTKETINVDGQVIVERYFMKDNNGTLELRCDAGRYVPEVIESDTSSSNTNLSGAVITQTSLTGATVHNMDDDGALIISGIDDFQVLLGVKTASGIQYQTITEYLSNSSAASANINSVKMGVLAKGLVADNSGGVPSNPSYQLLGQTITMKSDQPSNVIRRAYETTTMLRNSRGE